MNLKTLAASLAAFTLSAAVCSGNDMGAGSTQPRKKRKPNRTQQLQRPQTTTYQQTTVLQRRPPGLYTRPNGRVVHVYTVNPARERWIVNRMKALENQVEQCSDAEFSAGLSLVPGGSKWDDAMAATKYAMMKNHCHKVRFEYNALKSELKRRIRQRDGND